MTHNFRNFIRSVAAATISLLTCVGNCSAFNTIVSFDYPTLYQIAERISGPDAFVDGMQRNSAGTMLFVNCHKVGDRRSASTIVITKTNVSVVQTFPNATFDQRGSIHHWYDVTNREWIFASGMRVPGDRFAVFGSPGSEIVMIRRDAAWEVFADSTNRVLEISNWLTTIRSLAGTRENFCVVGLKGGNVLFHSFTRDQNGSYVRSEVSIPDLPRSCDADATTGRLIFAESTRFFPRGFEIDVRSQKRRNLPFCSDFMLYVDDSLVPQLRKLSPDVKFDTRRK